MRKKNLKVLAVAGMLLTSSMFGNVYARENWSDKAIENALKNQIIKGDANGDIRAKDSLTRAELAAILNRVLNNKRGSDLNKFEDIKEGAWYYSDMSKAVSSRFIEGDSEKSLNPNGRVSREEAFTMLSRILLLESKESNKSIKDMDKLAKWAEDGTRAMVELGYVKGDKNGKINPKGAVTREEFIQLIDNTFGNYIDKEGTYKKDIEGNIVVTSSNVNLENTRIKGDLIISEGVGQGLVDLKNTIVEGRLIVRGGKNISLQGSTNIGRLIADNHEAELELKVDEGVVLKKIDKKTKVKLDSKEVKIEEDKGSNLVGETSSSRPSQPVESKPGEDKKSEDFKLKLASLEDDCMVVLEYTEKVKETESTTFIFGKGIEILDKKGRLINPKNISREDGKIIIFYDRSNLPVKVNISEADIFADSQGRKNKIENNIKIVDNRSDLVEKDIAVEKMGDHEIKLVIPFNRDLDVDSFRDGVELSIAGKNLNISKKIEKDKYSLSLYFEAEDKISTSDTVKISFKDIKLIDTKKIKEFEIERTMDLDKEVDDIIGELMDEGKGYLSDIMSPVGIYGLTDEVNQYNYWPTPAFENALNYLKDSLANYQNLVDKIDKELVDIKALSGDNYKKVEELEDLRGDLATTIEFVNGSLAPRGDKLIREANKTEDIKRRMRDVAGKMHHHFVHSLLMEPEKLEALIDSMPGERQLADKIEYSYMKKMATDDIDEMEAKLKAIKVVSDFYNEKDLGKAYTQIEKVKGELKRLPAAIGNELYDFILDKIEMCIEFEKTKGNSDGQVNDIFKVEEVRLLDGNIVEVEFNNPIVWYDHFFKESNVLFALKSSEEDGYDNFISVENTELELNSKVARLTIKEGQIPRYYFIPDGVKVEDSRKMNPKEQGMTEIKDLRTNK